MQKDPWNLKYLIIKIWKNKKIETMFLKICRFRVVPALRQTIDVSCVGDAQYQHVQGVENVSYPKNRISGLAILPLCSQG